MKTWLLRVLRHRCAWFFRTQDESGLVYPARLHVGSLLFMLIVPFAVWGSIALRHPAPAIWCTVLAFIAVANDLHAHGLYCSGLTYGLSIGRDRTIHEIVNDWDKNQIDPREWIMQDIYLRGHAKLAAEQVAKSHRSDPPP